MAEMRRFLCLLLAIPISADAEIRYTLQLDPPAKSIRVSVTVDEPGKRPVFRIPAWCPGFYFLQKYQEKISDVKALDAGGYSLEVKSLEPRAWAAENPSSGTVTLSYSVLGDDAGLGFFGVNVIRHTAFINGPAAFMYVEGRKEEAARLTVKNPQGWDIATSMSKVSDLTYTTQDYDELIDHPLQLGKFERRQFQVEGIPIEAVFVSKNQRYAANLDEEVEILRMISATPIKLFEGAPFKRYLYLVHLDVGDFNGGLEHRSSTVIATDNVKPLGTEHLAAHEHFHAWNVKQIRPVNLGPFDYTKPSRTGNLWWAEGVTDYYAALNVFKSGRESSSILLARFQDQVRALQASKNRLKFSAEDASTKAWENGGFGVGDLSYYTKGFVMGLILDAAIRDATKSAKSLDDVMRALYKKHRLPKPGFGEDDLRKTINEVAGKDLSSLYERIARTTHELPYAELMKIGIRVVEPNQRRPMLGYTLAHGYVTSVVPDLLSQLQVGDRILEIDGKPFAIGAFSSVRDRYRAKLKRSDQELELVLPVVSVPSAQWTLEANPFATGTEEAYLGVFLSR